MKKKTPKKIESPNRFREEIGRITPQQEREVRKRLRSFLHVLVMMQRATLRELRKDPESKDLSPCSTCALNPRTFRMKGFLPTSYGFLTALRDGKKFVCHDNQPQWRKGLIDLSKIKLCNGWLALQIVEAQYLQDFARQVSRDVRACTR